MREIKKTLEESKGPSPVHRCATGAAYEQMAVRYLEENGYRILDRNYRIRSGEIDVIAADGDQIVFCEVKYRSSKHVESALSAVDRKKQAKIIRVARYYLMRHQAFKSCAVRFDVVGINQQGEITHIQNAFGETW